MELKRNSCEIKKRKTPIPFIFFLYFDNETGLFPLFAVFMSTNDVNITIKH